ncbi:MAG: hypothetical protein Q8O67_02725 [Deltaproteobacteria bacterium]|nr:hypothetical protein [Deltaproteobacteria bacterium]
MSEESVETLVPIRVLARIQRGSERLLANLVGMGKRVAMVEADGLCIGDVVALRFFVPGAVGVCTLAATVTGALDENGTVHSLLLEDELPASLKDMMLKRGGASS